MTTFEFEAIGTHWKIDIADSLSKEGEAVLLQKIMKRIDEFDKTYSRFRKDSLITKMSQEAGEYILPQDADKMILLYKKIFDITGGLVTPLIGQVLVDTGYDSNYSLKERTPTMPKSWDEILKWENPKLTLFSPAVMDFGAGGKGYLVDIISEILEVEGIKSYCVDAGGDMRHRNSENIFLRVGLENPDNFEEVIGVVELGNKSLCGSAGNRRKWGAYHHIINPETLSSPKEVSAVWCVAETTLLADILTTALFFTSPEKLLKYFNFDFFIMYEDKTATQSVGFKAEIFTT